ncbi:MAG: aldehyde dehydrogenase EutE [Deltaproteobacteria bacterium]|nr:aldehyde dehydrogenase EutE [Deltaproteobacteria bacterium]
MTASGNGRAVVGATATAATSSSGAVTRPTSSSATGLFADMESAVSAAEAAYRELGGMSLAARQKFIDAMRRKAEEYAEPLAALTVEETGMGRVSSKVQKNLLAARATPGTEDLQPKAYTGDDGLTLVEPAPFGVVGAITPSTNPASTVVNNGISFVAAGNAAVFNPHPAAKRVTNETIRLMNEAIVEAGGPQNLLCSVERPSRESAQALMVHPTIRLLMVTGGEEVVNAAMSSGKRVVGAGPGNAPVLVDDTANITKAARAVVDGASFDNGLLCIAEKVLLVFDNVADRLKEEMLRYGAVEVRGRDLDRLTERCIDSSGSGYPMPKKDMVGRDASVLLSEIGVSAHPNARLVLAEVPDISHPLVQAEQLMPFLPMVRVRDLDEGLAWAKAVEHGFRHTACMHSENVSRMSRMAREIETTIFVKNAPSYGGLGFGGEGFTTLSIAGPTGEGLTSARTFTRQRRCVLAGAFRIV